MDENDWLAARFDEHRTHLRAVAYRMLGSVAEAEDAVQEAWLRASRAGAHDVENLGGWLTTIVGRICLNALRARNTRHEEAYGARLPDPIVRLESASQPEDEAELADSIGLAFLVVLESLTPAERLAFVLHDMFGLPFEDIAPMVDRSPTAARQLASRARRRVRGASGRGASGRGAGVRTSDRDVARQREVVDAFFAAARGGDLDGLVSILDPDVVLRSDLGPKRRDASVVVNGPEDVASQALLFSLPNAELHPVLVNGAAGVLITVRGRPIAVMGFTVVGDMIVEIDALADPPRVRQVAGEVLS